MLESPASSPLFAAVVHECCMARLDATTPLRTSSNVYVRSYVRHVQWTTCTCMYSVYRWIVPENDAEFDDASTTQTFDLNRNSHRE